MKFVCPKCMSALSVTEYATAVCGARHSYDRSREGYYNLLLTATGGTHGDNREMVAARRKFLDTGAYLPLANTLSSMAAELVRDGDTLLDIGCGEGYYTEKIALAAEHAGKTVHVHGFDISKEAVKFAAKRVKSGVFAVASAYHMPIADASVDLAVNVFSPLAKEETVRILRHGGHFVMAIPDVNHLFGLKSAIYNTPYKNELQDAAIEGLRLVRCERISYTLELKSADEISALFMMTPYAYRTGAAERERVLSLNGLTTEVEFVVFVYEKE